MTEPQPVRPSMAAIALSVLLQTHMEFDDLPVTWIIDPDGLVRIDMKVDDLQAEDAVRAIAAALELDVERSTYKSIAKGPSECIGFEGRWASVNWSMRTYGRIRVSRVGEDPQHSA